MTGDRYDDLLVGLYTGAAPAWLPATARASFVDESVRRCCDLSAALAEHWPCTSYLARAVLGGDFPDRVCAAFPAACRHARELTGALHVAVTSVLAGADAPALVRELFRYESLRLPGLPVDRDAEVPLDRLRARRPLPAEAAVVRFELDVITAHVHIDLYRRSHASDAIALAYQAPARPRALAVYRRGGEVRAVDVTDAIAEAACA